MSWNNPGKAQCAGKKPERHLHMWGFTAPFFQKSYTKVRMHGKEKKQTIATQNVKPLQPNSSPDAVQDLDGGRELDAGHHQSKGSFLMPTTCGTSDTVHNSPCHFAQGMFQAA